MKSQPFLPSKHFARFLGKSLYIILLAIPFVSNSALGEAPVSNEISTDREIHNTFSESNDRGTAIEATNPMEMLNRLKGVYAMEDATSPSDAIDQALKALELEEPEDF